VWIGSWLSSALTPVLFSVVGEMVWGEFVLFWLIFPWVCSNGFLPWGFAIHLKENFLGLFLRVRLNSCSRFTLYCERNPSSGGSFLISCPVRWTWGCFFMGDPNLPPFFVACSDISSSPFAKGIDLSLFALITNASNCFSAHYLLTGSYSIFL